ncbi:MAG TPA: ABC transporter substrate binding protein [Acidiferrobacterales bacterium]|nr:ABC transporter substrate binding protein [Acidiferrobacterales bacterium]
MPTTDTQAKNRAPQASVRRVWVALHTVLLTAMLFVPGLADAARLTVLVVMTEHGPAYEEVLGSMRATLANAQDKKLSLHAITTDEFTQDGARTPDRNAPDLVVTVGTDAAMAVMQTQPAVPVYCSFLPQPAYAMLVNRARGEQVRVSALYLDQPFVRQLHLIRLALPAHARIGVVLGPESRKNERALRNAVSAVGATLRVEQISDEKQLIGALHQVMDKADILLAVPDPLVFNRNTAQNVLLTTYRLGKPVAGYSRAYVTAGALLSVYSTPAQIGRQIGEELLAMQDRPGRALPAPGYPRYFSVEINERVARSLGIEPGQADDLTRRLVEKTAGSSHE